jgi:diacylglycerol kinase (ATP)
MKKNKLMNSFYYAFKGIGFAWQERNFKLHVLSSILALSVAYILLCIGVVLMAEVFNTAIEKIIDLVSPDHSAKAGAIKDLAAAAVLLISIVVAIVAVIIFTPYIFK